MFVAYFVDFAPVEVDEGAWVCAQNGDGGVDAVVEVVGGVVSGSA